MSKMRGHQRSLRRRRKCASGVGLAYQRRRHLFRVSYGLAAASVVNVWRLNSKLKTGENRKEINGVWRRKWRRISVNGGRRRNEKRVACNGCSSAKTVIHHLAWHEISVRSCRPANLAQKGRICEENIMLPEKQWKQHRARKWGEISRRIISYHRRRNLRRRRNGGYAKTLMA